ncbi:MAG: type III-B CRISPR module RAMP protein Cmr6 [Micromonosporaceae bacterium]|nr:type III-B CRISPR module RAMP protein Cmr6 [Micromonosporaceae bacterium]
MTTDPSGAPPNPATAMPAQAPRPSPAAMPPRAPRPIPTPADVGPRRDVRRPADAGSSHRADLPSPGRGNRPLVDQPGPAAGPLGRVLFCDRRVVKPRAGYQFGQDSNALVVMRQVAFCDQNGIWKHGKQALLAWARDHQLGQDPKRLAEVAARRDAAVAARVASGRRRGVNVIHRRLTVTPEWRLVTGIGDRANPNEIGIALHGTYGWPMIPGSTLKGASRAWAGMRGVDAGLVDRILGPPPRSGAHHTGTVDVLDALPTGAAPIRVVIDGVTPHVQPYYSGKAAPGEWHNPVPSAFLAVCRGSFTVDLIGPGDDVDNDVEEVAAWCSGACEDLGIGAKTGAGYGYLDVHDLTQE